MAKDARVCSVCGGRVIPIAYGFPTPEMWEAEERGEITLGGCDMDAWLPSWQCTECHHQGGQRDGSEPWDAVLRSLGDRDAAPAPRRRGRRSDWTVTP